MKVDENPPRKCVHCDKLIEYAEYIRSKFCPFCKVLFTKPPTPDKGQFINPDKVSQKELVRIDDWALKLMHKHEHLFSDKIPKGKIIIQEPLKPEDVDVEQIYDFTDLSYQIYRDTYGEWAIRIMQGNRMLVNAAYKKV